MGVYVIAEAGCEHLGDMSRARELIDAAKQAGADCVKFQLFSPEEVGEVVWYDQRVGECWLSPGDLRSLKYYARDVGIDFLCSAFGIRSLQEIYIMGCNTVKVPAPCNENIEYLVEAVRRFDKVIISLGMCTGDQFYNILERTPWPNRKAIEFLHCTSAYPVEYNQVNLNVLNSEWRGHRIYSGLSDHTTGWTVPVAAVALGAGIIEKHITLFDRKGPDGLMATAPLDFEYMVNRIREVEQAMGDGVKKIESSERDLLWRKT